MKTEIEFTGTESPAEIVKAAIDEFVRYPHPADPIIFYENSIPMMRYQFQGGDIDFSCTYRLDTMLQTFYAEAEQVFDEIVATGLVDISYRETLVRYIAVGGMTNMLSRLLILQAEIFQHNFSEQRVIARGLFLQAAAKQLKPKDETLLTRAVSQPVKGWIDDVVGAAAKKQRDFLVGFMNSQPLFNIPTGAIGRPKGTTKSAEKRKQDAKKFEGEIERAVRSLFTKTGKLPKKTAVADALGTGGLNLSKGSDTRLNSFNNKLTRLKINYAALIQSLDLHE